MKKSDLIKFAEFLGLDYTDVGDNIFITCPFAQWTHKSGRDRTPSMSLQVNLRGDSQYNCFGCSQHGVTLDEMLFKLQDKGFSQTQSRQALIFVEAAERATLSLDVGYEEATSPPDVIRLGGPPPGTVASYNEEDFKRNFPSALDDAAALAYLRGRSISEATIRQFEIGYDRTDERVVLPVRWHDGTIVGAIGRMARPLRTKRDGKMEMPYYNYWKFPKSTLLFGEYMLTRDPVVVCEGPFDAVQVRQAGFNAVATMGAKFSDHQIDKLIEWGEPVVVLFDNDDEGQREADRLVMRLRRYGSAINCRPVKDKKDPGSMSDQEINDVLGPVCGKSEVQPPVRWGDLDL